MVCCCSVLQKQESPFDKSLAVILAPVTGESRSFAMSTAGRAAAAAVQRLVYTGDQSLIGRMSGVAVEFK